MKTLFMSKFKISILLTILSIYSGLSQQYEIGLLGGGSKYIGDVGKEDYFLPSNLGGTLLFKTTINPWMSHRFGLSFFQISGNDSQSYNKGRNMRNYSFKSNIIELNFGIEYNFFPRNPYLKRTKYNKFTPFMFGGISLFNFNGTLIQNSTAISSDYNSFNWGIPMILGIKYKISEHFLLTAESGARYTFTDNLDGTSKKSKVYDFNLLKTTNTNSNDWYTFTSIGIIYTFGDLNCYFGF